MPASEDILPSNPAQWLRTLGLRAVARSIRDADETARDERTRRLVLIAEARADGIPMAQIAAALGIARWSAYRLYDRCLPVRPSALWCQRHDPAAEAD